jgi:hypothetical protein
MSCISGLISVTIEARTPISVMPEPQLMVRPSVRSALFRRMSPWLLPLIELYLMALLAALAAEEYG